MRPTLYGLPHTRTMRVRWLLAELQMVQGRDFELEEVPLLDASPTSLNINPNCKQPFFVDADGTKVFESLAINTYLIDSYGGASPLAPRSKAEKAALYTWSMWAATELDMRVWEGMMLTDGMARINHPVANDAAFRAYFGRERSAERSERILAELESGPLPALNAALAGKQWLCGERFTAADLNVSAVAWWLKLLHADERVLRPFANLGRWLKAATGRPVFQALARESKAADRAGLFKLSKGASFEARYGTL